MSNEKRSDRAGERRGKWQLALALAASFVLVGGVAAGELFRVVRLTLQPESELTVSGTSSVHDWSCAAGEILAELRVRVPDARPGADVPDAIDRVTVGIPVAAIDCDNGTMNGKLREALKADAHPRIEFRMDRYEIVRDPSSEASFVVVASGDLTIAGTTRPVDLQVRAEDSGSGGLRITGLTQILMTDFGVKPPTAMLGLLKAHDRVTIQFDLVATYEELASKLCADHADLVAAGEHGYLYRGDVLMGGVATRLPTESPCSALIAPAPGRRPLVETVSDRGAEEGPERYPPAAPSASDARTV